MLREPQHDREQNTLRTVERTRALQELQKEIFHLQYHAILLFINSTENLCQNFGYS